MNLYKRPQQGAAAHVLVFSYRIETTVAGRATRRPVTHGHALDMRSITACSGAAARLGKRHWNY